MGVEFVGNELGGIKDHPELSQSFTHVPISRGELIQSQGLDRYGFVRPVQGEAFQCSRIVFGRTHFEELPFPAFE